ncbi:MAG: tape measure protein [Bacteroidales bacterium]|nr:tape measure protein [Bacteroidales bacterium]
MSSNTVELKVKITDYGGFKRLEVDANDFNGAVERIKRETEKLGTGLGRFSEIAIGVNQAFDLVRNTVGKVGEALRKVIDVGASNELQKLNLTTLFKGNAEAAEDMFARISKYGKETVYDKEGLLEAQKTMMSFGISGEKAFETLQHIGDIAMGDGQKMQSLALAFSQATSTGKLMGQDLMQMINAGFNPLAVISEHTGKSMAELKDEMGKGAISAEMLAQAFEWATEEGSLFYQGAESAGNTTDGKINQLKDTFNEFLIDVFNKLQPVINAVIDFSTNVLNAIPSVLENIHTTFGNVIDTISDFRGIIIGVASAIAALTIAVNANKIAMAAQELILNLLIVKEKIQIVVTKAWKAAQAALNLVLKSNPIGLIVSAIAILVGAIATVVRNTTGWGETWESVVNYINKSLGQMGAWFKLKWLQISDYFLSGIEDIMRAWYKLQSLWDKDAADKGLASMQSKAEERAKAIAEQKEILEGKRQDRKETSVTWAVKWERKSKREAESISPAEIIAGETQAVEEAIEEQETVIEEHGNKTVEIAKTAAEDKAQETADGYQTELDALQDCLDDTEIALKMSLAANEITQEQYDRQMLVEKARFYEDMLKLTRAYGKNDRQALKDVLDAELSLQNFDNRQKESKGNQGSTAAGSSFGTFTKGWGGLKGIGNSIRDIKSALTETDNAWDALTQTVDGFISMFQNLQQVVEIIDTITAATQTMQAADNAATQQQLANDASKVAGNTAVAGSGAASAMASIPYVGPVMAIAAVASVIGALASLPKFANGGLVYGPTVGLMGEYSGASNNPEVIAPLNKLRSLLGDDSGGGSSVVEFHIKGRELVGILNKQNNIYKRSE